jgi:hypothetical protein
MQFIHYERICPGSMQQLGYPGLRCVICLGIHGAMQSVTHLLRAEHVRETSRRREGGVRGSEEERERIWVEGRREEE